MPFFGVLFAGAIAGVGATIGQELAERYFLPHFRKWCDDLEDICDEKKEEEAIVPVADEWVDRQDGKDH